MSGIHRGVRLAPLVLAATLFVANDLAVLSGWWKTPPGYVPMGVNRTIDVAQYITWLQAFQHQALIPNHHLPWITEPALWNPYFLAVARLSRLAGIDLRAGFQFSRFLVYLFTAYALLYALRVFTDSRGQALAAFLVAVCAVPLRSLVLLPVHVFGIRTGPAFFLAARDFGEITSDGFLHCITENVLVTFGTGITLLCMALLGRYFQTRKMHYLRYAATGAFLSALLHPFEVVVIVAAGSLALLLARVDTLPRTAAAVLLLAIPGALGTAPYAVLAFRHDWVRDLAEWNEWRPVPVDELLLALGLPSMLVLLFLVWRPRLAQFSDLLLQCWFVVALAGVYVPGLPFQRHFLDGVLYAAGLLLVRQSVQIAPLMRFLLGKPHIAFAGLGAVFLLSLAAHAAFRLQAFRDGYAIKPRFMYSSVAPVDEVAAIEWLRRNARSDQLVLAPHENAPWFATVPMHSFASHPKSGMAEYRKHVELARAFYAGTLEHETARRLLSDLGVRYVVVPNGSRALRYLSDSLLRIRFNELAIHEFPENSMRPYRTSH
ncbi:MAG: hypothetical protein IT158_21015 [Bryobacterales bacterium]|nr:hypothetical protein [Bryobacterales bacterium]